MLNMLRFYCSRQWFKGVKFEIKFSFPLFIDVVDVAFIVLLIIYHKFFNIFKLVLKVRVFFKPILREVRHENLT